MSYEDIRVFLLSRIEEDEDAARSAGPRRWYRDGLSSITDAENQPVLYGDGQPATEEADHMVRWNPARVLAECEAKRRIVELWADEWHEWHGPGSGLKRTTMTDDQFQRVLDAERVLGLLAESYADHPDYQKEWAVR